MSAQRPGACAAARVLRAAPRGALGVALLAALAAPDAARASYAFYVGRDLTEGGVVLVGGTGEEVSSHWLEIVPAKGHPPDATIEVGVTAEARIPGERMRIPQAARTFRHLTMDYSDFAGFPPPLTNGGLNAHQVAVRDVWSPSREELVERTPRPQRGVQYSDLARIALERARTAREAVEIAGALVDRHGYATYGGNSHLFADPQEGWVMLQLAGGEGLWVAERLGPDDVRVSYPGYIGEIPADYRDHPDYMGSANLIAYAVEQGWYDPDAGEPFDVHRVYGRQGVAMRSPGAKHVDAATLEAELRAMAPVGVREMMDLVRDPRIADDEAGTGQVAALRDEAHPGLRLLWIAPTGSLTAPFLPWRIGVREIPPEYRQHRYLTRESGSTFLHPDYQLQEATRFAARTFKRLLYWTCADPERFLPEVTGALADFENRLLAEQADLEAVARRLYDAGDEALAGRVLTFYAHARAEDALALGE
ncbi:MAG: C69 family dipeptidase, partial [Myxococcota bacterium]|nr:C69 family dipeptidase [Myxococcota bacterium]